MSTFADMGLAVGFGDPGAVDPRSLQPASPVTNLWYGRLPGMYQVADAEDTTTGLGYPLWGYLDAMASVLAEPLRIGELIAAGMLTNPSTAPDEWIPWMAQATGVGGVGVAAQRSRLANLIAAPPLGSRHYLEILTQTFLSGTRAVTVTATPPWGIRILVRAEEILPVGGASGLVSALYATGLIPAGFLLDVETDVATWGQMAAVMPTWAAGAGLSWARTQGLALTGSGFAVGGVNWKGTALG